MAPRASVLVQRQPLMVRLRVWHRSEYRRSYAINQYLAYILSGSNLHGWTAKTALERTSSPSSRLHFTIFDDMLIRFALFVQANLHYGGDNLEFAQTTLRVVFVRTINFHLPEMFKRRKDKPLYVTIHAVGNAIPDDLHTKFTDFIVLQSLEVESQAYASGCSVTERDFVVKRICMLLDVPLDCLELFTMFLQITFGDVPLLKDVDMCIKPLKSDKESGVLAQWLKGIGEHPSVVDGTITKEIEALWNESLTSFWYVQILSRQVQGCIENLSKGRAIGDQDLLDSLILMQRAVIHFSQFELFMGKLTEPLLKMHGSEPYVVDNKMNILVGTAVLSFIPGFGPVSAFLSSAGGMKVVAFCQRLQKRRTVQDLGDAMNDFGNYMQKAQVSLAAQFCKQILGSRLESLRIVKRSDTLKKLGVDVKHLRVQKFGDDQIVKTLELFYESYQNFKAKREKVRDDAGLKEAIKIGPIE